MPANAEVLLGIKADTSDALNGINRISNRLRNLKAEANKEFFTKLSFQKAGAVGLGMANMGLDIAEALLPANSEGSKLAQTLRSISSSTKTYMAALAPLAPPFGAMIGSSIGLVTGALKSLSAASKEEAEKIRKNAESLRKGGQATTDRAADFEWKWSHATLDERAAMQHEARGRMERYRFNLERGASVSEADIFDAANWDKALTERMLEAFKGQNGGKFTDALRPLATYFALPKLTAAEEAYEKASSAFAAARTAADQVPEGWARGRRLREIAADRKAEADRARERRDELSASFGELTGGGVDWTEPFDTVLKTFSYAGKTRFNGYLDQRFKELNEKRDDDAPLTGSDVAEAFKPAPGVRAAQADSWSAQGIGYTGNPMQTTETLLREIGARLAEMRDIARRTARIPLPAVAI